MGQTSSTHRNREAFARRDTRRFSQLARDGDWSSDPNGLERTPTTNPGQRQRSSTPPLPARSSPSESSASSQAFATFRRQISAQSVAVPGGMAGSGRGSSTRDEVLYEQEERPLMNIEDLRMRDARITHITASPMPRRASMMSRLGSRILPRYANTGSTSVDDAGDGGRTLRRRLSDTPPSPPLGNPDSRRRRFSIFGSVSAGLSTSHRSGRRRNLASISRPMPLMEDGSVPPSGLSNGPLPSPTPPSSPRATRQRLPRSTTSPLPRQSRMSRVRRSMTSIENLFGDNTGSSSSEHQTQTPPRRPLRAAMHDETDYLLPPLRINETSLDLDESALGAYESAEPRNNESNFPATEPIERSSTWGQRWADRTPAMRREARRVPNLLRGRSSRLIRRDDEAPLSRILQLAAAAIAAQLSGAADGAPNLEAIGDESIDGSLNNFLENMGNGNGTPAGNEAHRTLATLPPLNFLRVFRFVHPNPQVRPESTRPNHQSIGRNPQNNAPTNEESDEAADGRTVTLVVVGVRSVPSSSINREDVEQNMDTLLSLPIVPAPAPLRTGSTGGGLLRNASGRSRFPHRRRASMGGVNPFPANYDSQRHQRMHSSSRSVSGDTTPITATAIPMVLSESPPGPHPPPSTPAEPGLSAQVSGATTPSRRPSSASAIHSPVAGYHENILERLHETHDAEDQRNDPLHTVRPRRRSDSEFARHRDLGSGAARRNGVVEPDDAPSQSGRSWLIYVVGTNLSEDHPAFATPSLFTDVCTRPEK